MYPLISKYHNNPSIVNLHKVRLGYESLVRFVVRDGNSNICRVFKSKDSISFPFSAAFMKTKLLS